MKLLFGLCKYARLLHCIIKPLVHTRTNPTARNFFSQKQGNKQNVLSFLELTCFSQNSVWYKSLNSLWSPASTLQLCSQALLCVGTRLIRDWNLKSFSQLDFGRFHFRPIRAQRAQFVIFQFISTVVTRLTLFRLVSFLHTVCSSFSCILYQRIPPKMSVRDIYYSTRYSDDTGEFEYRWEL